jgi:RNA polymerase sigma-70 factor (ECF subfamily)
MPKPLPSQFDQFVAPHLETLFRMAYRLVRNTADAQDLVQDTCVAAFDNLPALATADSPLRWLLRVQYNRFVDTCRRRRQSPLASADEADIATLSSDLPDPEQLLQQFQSEELLQQAFLRLDEIQRTILSLRAEGYDLLEIEAITGVDRNALSARIHRARLRLSQLVNNLNRGTARIRHMGGRS